MNQALYAHMNNKRKMKKKKKEKILLQCSAIMELVAQCPPVVDYVPILCEDTSSAHVLSLSSAASS
jgi:hypothetical protein